MSGRKVTGSAATGGAAGLSAIASFIGLCCIGPWTVALFGVPGAVALARWQPVRPYLLAAAAGLLIWAFWRVYRPLPANGTACDAKRRSVWLQIALWASAALFLVAVFADQLQWILVDPTPEGLR
ncbi:MAG: mercuric transporter MerT family protein [Parvularculaceae bacterium]